MSITSQTIGMTAGPALAAVIAGRFGYVGITVMGLGCFAASLPPLVLLVLNLRKHKTVSTASAPL